MPSTLVRLGGVAAVVAGLLLAAKGVAIIAFDRDPSFVPPATLLFALGMLGLHARLRGGGGPLGTVGVFLAWVALAASVVNVEGLALSIPAPADPDVPALLEITYMVAFLGILVGLLVLGVARFAGGGYGRALGHRAAGRGGAVVPLAGHRVRDL